MTKLSITIRILFKFILLILLFGSLAFAEIDLANIINEDGIYTPDGHCLGTMINWDDECVRLRLQKHMRKEIADKFEETFYEFQAAIKTRDAKAAASLVHYPIKIVYVKPGTKRYDWPRDYLLKEIRTPKEFEKDFNFIFNKHFSKDIINRKFKDTSQLMKYSFSIISPFSELSFRLFCSTLPIEPINGCKDFEVRVDFINNDNTMD